MLYSIDARPLLGLLEGVVVENKFVLLRLILFFGVSLAALGANDLHRDYKGSQRPKRAAARELVKDLQGDVESPKAQYGSAGVTFDSTRGVRDDLDRSDRRQLADLIGVLAE